jgi:hypothetical protein
MEDNISFERINNGNVTNSCRAAKTQKSFMAREATH